MTQYFLSFPHRRGSKSAPLYMPSIIFYYYHHSHFKHVSATHLSIKRNNSCIIIIIQSSVNSFPALWGCFRSTSPASRLSTTWPLRYLLSSLCYASSTQCCPFFASRGSFSFGSSTCLQIIEGKLQRFRNRQLTTQ